MHDKFVTLTLQAGLTYMWTFRNPYPTGHLTYVLCHISQEERFTYIWVKD